MGREWRSSYALGAQTADLSVVERDLGARTIVARSDGVYTRKLTIEFDVQNCIKSVLVLPLLSPNVYTGVPHDGDGHAP